DRAVDETLEVERPFRVLDGVSLQVVLDDVRALDEGRRERAGEEETLGVVRMAHADVAVRIDDVLPREDAVGNDELGDQLFNHVFQSLRDASMSSPAVSPTGPTPCSTSASAAAPCRCTPSTSAVSPE